MTPQTKPPLDPLRILQTLILQIGAGSDGWGVDILIAAMEYLSSESPAKYIESRTQFKTPEGFRILCSTVDFWNRNVPRGLINVEGKIEWTM